METVQFRVGETAGKLIMEIAQEHLLYEYDIQKAIATITESLSGCSDELARKILIGDYVINVNVVEQNFVVEQRNDQNSELFPFIDVTNWCKENRKRIYTESKDFIDRFSAAKSTLFKALNLYIDKNSLLCLISGKTDDFLETILENHNVDMLITFIRAIRNHIEQSYKIIQVIQTFESWFPEKCLSINNDDIHLQELVRLEMKLHDFVNGNISMEKEDLEKFVEASIEIGKTLSEKITPVDLYDNYSAGWLSPEGVYYALNGEFANMLHLNIAASLKDAEIIPKDCENADSWLEQNGWVKIHGNSIQFAGCLNDKMGLKNVDITPKQINLIYNYGQRCHLGILKMGWRLTKISAARFEMLANADLERLYSEYFYF